MYKIMIKGDIITNDYKWMYDWMEWDGTCPDDIKNGIEKAAGDDIVIEINSPGGICNAAFEMYTALKEYKGNVEVHIVGLAASAASLIACAGDKTLISNVGMIMIHNTSGSASGDYRELESAANSLIQYNDAIINAYMEKTGKKKEELQDLMDNTTYMSANVAIENKFADGLINFDNDDENDNNLMSGVVNIGSGKTFEAVAAIGTTHIMSRDALAKFAKKIKQDDDETNKKITDQKDASAKDAEKTDLLLNKDNKIEGGKNNMTLEELRKEHPELAKEMDDSIANAKEEGKKEGVELERSRIKDIDSISGSVPADMIKEAKYTDTEMTASDLALKVMQKNAESGKSYMKDALDDSKESGVKDIESNPDDAKKSKEDKEINALVSAANGRKGGKR